VNRLVQLWRTTTFRLTALFILIFVVFSVLLLAIISYQSSVQIQRQQSNDIDREVAQIERLDRERGFRASILRVDQLSRQPGPGIYYIGTENGLMITGNVSDLPVNVLQEPGTFSFNYDRVRPDVADIPADRREGSALVRSARLTSGLILVVGRDVVERRGFTALAIEGARGNAAASWQLQLTVEGDRPAQTLCHQLEKLYDCQRVQLHALAGAPA
jgi:acetolactate synthase regulatory subunit